MICKFTKFCGFQKNRIKCEKEPSSEHSVQYLVRFEVSEIGEV